MELYFLRHGKADELALGERDSQRKLSPEGEADIQRLAKHLKSMGFAPGAIISSPLARASQTTRIIAKELGLTGLHSEDERLAHGCGFGELQQIVEPYTHQKRILIVGHQPDMGRFALRLCGEFNISVPPGTLFRIDAETVDPGTGVLKWLIQPTALNKEELQ